MVARIFQKDNRRFCRKIDRFPFQVVTSELSIVQTAKCSGKVTDESTWVEKIFCKFWIFLRVICLCFSHCIVGGRKYRPDGRKGDQEDE